ncbi:LemA family protein [Patescibacteria group bacterium]
MKKTVLIIIAIVAMTALYFVNTYNSMVTKTQDMDGQWAQVETQYQRRFDLIPNLVSSVKGIFEQEQDVFGAIAEARTKYSGAQSVDEKAQAATQVESALARLLVIVENYPQLQSNTTVLGLMDELAGTENRISVERKRFNDLVRVYNTMIKRFPTNIVANMFNFDARAFFEAVEAAQEAPQVDLTTN